MDDQRAAAASIQTKIDLAAAFYAMVLILTAFTLTLFVWRYPTVNDMWSFAGRHLSLVDTIHYQWDSYLHNNPRIGQIFLPPLESRTALRSVFCVFDFSALVSVCVAIARPPRKDWLLYAIISVGYLAYCNSDSGVMIIYLPYNCNYIFGLLILLVFLSIYAADLWHPLSQPWLPAITIPLGFVAGLTNEHSVPYAILITVAFCAWRGRGAKWWAIFGAAALIVGYAELFFAPGQSQRYGGIEYNHFHLNAGLLIAQAGLVCETLIEQSWLSLVVAGALFPLAIMSLGRRHPRIIVAGAAFLGTFGMSGPLVVSPLLGPRLIFDANVCTMIAIITLLPAISFRLDRIAGAVSVLAITAFLSQGFYWVFSYHDAFTAWASDLRQQKAAGVEDATAPNYEKPFLTNRRFIMWDAGRSDPAGYPNPEIAQYFGFKSFRFSD